MNICELLSTPTEKSVTFPSRRMWDTESYESMRPNTVPSALEYRYAVLPSSRVSRMVTGLSFVLYTSAALIAFPELSTLTFWDTECYSFAQLPHVPPSMVRSHAPELTPVAMASCVT